jgi:muramoyltetrapeptide carboxypeptidase
VDQDLLAAGVGELRRLGFAVRVPAEIGARTRFTAGSVARRIDELTGLFEAEEVRAVLCARGGAGALQLLSSLDLDRLLAHPKPLVGYSDVTVLHQALNAQGLVTFHGPMVARDFSTRGYDRESLWHALTGEGSPYASGLDDLIALRPGSATGTLRGGCLSMLAALAGTPWALRCEEASVLFLEDVDEPPYRIDRMLRQLRASGGLEHVVGVVFGDMRGCAPPIDADFSLEEVILEALEGLELPVALGLSSGHTASPNLTLPLGVPARLSCEAEARLEVLEAAVG